MNRFKKPPKTWFFRKLYAASFRTFKYISNLYVHLRFVVLPNKKKLKNRYSKNKHHNMIVSLTSFPARIHKVSITIETIFKQKLQANMIILWLAESQFPNKMNDLPKELLKQQNRGLTIRFCDDLKPHKKYYYTLLEYPNDIIITVDDDVAYPNNLLSKLVEFNRQYPNDVICNRARYVSFDSNGGFLPYNQWLLVEGFSKGFNMLPTGVGGVLYPPGVFDKQVLNKEVFMDLSPMADDLWLRIMSFLNQRKVIRTDFPYHKFLSIRGSQKEALWKTNVSEDKNDLYWRKLIDYFELDADNFK